MMAGGGASMTKELGLDGENTSLVRSVDEPSPSRSVPILGLVVSIVAFLVCMGVVVEHLFTRDLVAAVVFGSSEFGVARWVEV